MTVTQGEPMVTNYCRMCEAKAKRIEKLEAENTRMREALHPFALVNSSEPFLSITVKSSDVKRARQALGETQ